MDVKFRTAFGEDMVLKIDPSDNITSVKEMLSEESQISMADILLFYHSYNLRDDLKIEELELKDDDFIGIRIHKRPIVKDIRTDDPNIVNLMNFGFSRQASLTALISSNNNFNQALELLLNNGGEDENQNNGNENVPAANIPLSQGDGPIERLMNFSGFERSIVQQVFDSFHQNEEEARNYIQQMISG